VNGDGSPEIQNNDIVFTGVLSGNSLLFSYTVMVPVGETGAKELRAVVEYCLSDMINPATIQVMPNPATIVEILYHSADYRDPRLAIDGTEVNRVLAYWRAGSYRPDATGLDGFAPGAGSITGLYHSADYRDPRWVIDGTEVNRVLAYWRAGAYHADAVGLDGFAPGTSTRSSFTLRTIPTASHQLQGGGTTYSPSSTVTVTGTFEYTGTLLSLLWRPHLPNGWTIGSVSGDGTVEKVGGEIIWTGSLPISPVHINYNVTIPADVVATATIRDEVEYQLSGQVNPVSVWTNTDPLSLTQAESSLPWMFTINLTNADKNTVELGMQIGATNEYDAAYDCDSPAAPAPDIPEGGIYFFDADDFLYQRDVHALAAMDSWNLEVVANQQPMTLTWDANTIPAGRQLLLHEVNATGATIPDTLINMETTTTLIVQAQTVKYFVISVAPIDTVQTVNLSFAQYWNLISLPVEPINPAVNAVLGIPTRDNATSGANMRDGSRGTVFAGTVWRYVNNGTGTAHYEAVTEMHALVGYWVYSTTVTTIPITGIPLTANQTLALYKGWNLIGPTANVGVPQNASLQGHVWWWDTTACYYNSLDPINGNLIPGKGYWLYVKQPVDLDFGR